jgi:hypothetical protein
MDRRKGLMSSKATTAMVGAAMAMSRGEDWPNLIEDRHAGHY